MSLVALVSVCLVSAPCSVDQTVLARSGEGELHTWRCPGEWYGQGFGSVSLVIGEVGDKSA